MARAGGGVINWEIGIDIYTLIFIKWITYKNLLYKKKISMKIISRISGKLINCSALSRRLTGIPVSQTVITEEDLRTSDSEKNRVKK